MRVWKGTTAYAARVTLAAGEVKQVAWSDLKTVPSAQVATKGHIETPDVEGLESLTPEARVEFEQKYLLIGDGLELWATNAEIAQRWFKTDRKPTREFGMGVSLVVSSPRWDETPRRGRP